MGRPTAVHLRPSDVVDVAITHDAALDGQRPERRVILASPWCGGLMTAEEAAELHRVKTASASVEDS